MKSKSILQKLKLTFMILLVFSLAKSNAQVPVGSDDEQEELIVSDIKQEKPCTSPSSKSTSVVLYKKSATAYVEFTNTEGGEFNVQLIKIGDVKGSRSFQASNNALLLRNLEHDASYVITTNNSCNQAVILAQFTTYFSKGSEIEVSNPLFNAISQWQVNPQNRKLTDFIKGLTDISAHEKLSFIQQYYDKEPIIEGNSDIEDDIQGIGGSPEGVLACFDKVIINKSQSVTPADPGIVYGDGTLIPVGFALPNWVSDGSYSKYWYMTSNRGAAKYQQLRQEGTQKGELEVYYRNVQDAKSTTFGQLSYSLVNTNGLELPSNCGCEKILDITARYDTKLRASSTLRSCFLCSRGAASAAEDWAVAVAYNLATNSSIVLSAGKANVKSECQKVVNKDWWLNVVDIAGTIGKGVLYFSNIDTNSIKAVSLVSDLTTQIKSLIKETYFKKFACSGGVNQGALIDTTRRITLKQNEPLRISLFSFSNLSASGFKAYDNIVEVFSDFHLAGVIRNSLNEPEECCSNKIANWVLGWTGGSPLESYSLRQQVGTFFNNWSPWDATYNPWTNAVELPADIGSLYKQTYSHAGAPFLDDQFQILYQQGEVYLKGNNIKQPFNYSIFDMSGRTVKIGKGVSNIEKLFEPNAQPNSGMYLVKVVNQGHTETHKIIFTK